MIRIKDDHQLDVSRRAVAALTEDLDERELIEIEDEWTELQLAALIGTIGRIKQEIREYEAAA